MHAHLRMQLVRGVSLLLPLLHVLLAVAVAESHPNSHTLGPSDPQLLLLGPQGVETVTGTVGNGTKSEFSAWNWDWRPKAALCYQTLFGLDILTFELGLLLMKLNIAFMMLSCLLFEGLYRAVATSNAGEMNKCSAGHRCKGP
ncbi:hypothetical protein ACLKA6_005980 [Drosophila palustris]